MPDYESEVLTSRDNAQNLSNHAGKVMRLYDDGCIPEDNPFIDEEGAKPEIMPMACAIFRECGFIRIQEKSGLTSTGRAEEMK